ncbi:MAG TPA: hypothetical protein DCS28_00390 [Candidatus Moranbacteria bacterium]|nr:hypothetical protein [Candidatus Moranbacteria bacterium]HAT74489.1 hypothetical protein [Candidatus Moranbacteria bacterium]
MGVEPRTKIFFSFFKKNFGARHQKNVKKIFLFWAQTSSKFAGGSGRGAKSRNRDFPQKKF